MSDQPGIESFEDDLGSYSIDDSVDAGEGQDDLLDSSEGDNEPSSPPDQQPRSTEWGTTAAEQAQEETIEQRIRQEEPDPNASYGAADDDDEFVEDDDEFLDDGEVGSGQAGIDGPEAQAMHVIEE